MYNNIIRLRYCLYMVSPAGTRLWCDVTYTIKLLADFRVTAGTPLHTSVTWFGYWYFRCKRSADKSNIQCIEKLIYRLDILFKPNPIITNLTWCYCVIWSHGSKIFTRRKQGKGGGEDIYFITYFMRIELFLFFHQRICEKFTFILFMQKIFVL